MREEFLKPYKVHERDKGMIILDMFAPGMVIDGNTDQIKQMPKAIKYDPKQFATIKTNLNGFTVFRVLHVPAKIKLQLPAEVIHPLVANNMELIPEKYRAPKKDKKA